MIDVILLPLIGFVIALFGVFFDPKQSSGGKSRGLISILILALALTAGFTGYSAWDKDQQARRDASKANKEADDAAAYNRSLSDALRALKETSGQIKNQLGQVFGLLTQNQTVPIVQNSLAADTALKQLDTEAQRASNSRITVEYFPKQLDQEVIWSALDTALVGAGFTLIKGNSNPHLLASSTNIVWYGKDVPDASVRMVALVLLRAGVQLKRLSPFTGKNADGAIKIRQIQIGAQSDGGLIDKEPVLTIEKVNTMPLPKH